MLTGVMSGKGKAVSPRRKAASSDRTQREIELELENGELRRAHEELIAAKIRYADLYEAAPVGYCTLGVGGLVLECNAAAAALLGVERDELVNRPLARFVLEEDAADYRMLCDQLAGTGGSHSRELRMVNKAGTHLWLHLEATARREAGTPAEIRLVLIDINKRKRIEAQFRLALEAAPTGMLMLDGTGRMVLVNAQIERLFGYRREELLGQRVEMLVPDRFRSHHPNLRASYFREPTTRPMGGGRELYGLRKDGTEVPIEIGLNPLRTPDGEFILSSVVDITERKRSDERFHLALEAAPTGMLMVDGTGTIVLVNDQIEKLFGYTRDELLGQPVEMLVPERFRSHHPDLRATFFRDPTTRPMGGGRELYGLRKDGTEVPIEIGLNPLRMTDGDFILSSVVDISQRQEIDRMRSGFISTVSHELRTPLTSISGSLGLLRSGTMGVLSDKAAAMVRIAYQNSERLVRIINDILDIGKIDAGAAELRLLSVPLMDLAQQAVEANTGYAEKYQIRFLFDCGYVNGQVMADTDRLIQVLTNLLSNAAKFSPPGADVLIRVLAGPAMMRVEVEDSGPGIPEEFRHRIFEKFAQADFSASRRFEGTGLGLSIARKLLEAMGGTIGFTTVIGQGTVFHFELARVEDAPAMLPDVHLTDTATYRALLSRAVAEPDSASLGIPKILHVEDDPDLISVIHEALAGQADVVSAHTLREAERLLSGGDFSLAVLDQSLPDGSGLNLIDRIPQLSGRAMPIIILSAADVSRDTHEKVAAVLIKSQVSAVRIATTILSYLPH